MIDAEHQVSDTLSLVNLSSLRPRPWSLLGLLSLAVAVCATVCGPPRLTIEPVEVRRVGDQLVIITEVENRGREPGQLHRHATLRSGGAEPVDLVIEDGAESTKTAKNEISEVAFTLTANAMPGAQGFDREWMVIEASDSRGSSVESSRFWVDMTASPPDLRPEPSKASWVANVALSDWKTAWQAWLATIAFFGIAAMPWVARKVERLKVDAEQPEADPFEDRPIRSSKEDGLGRSEFAKSIAECITKSRAGTSFSIAVTAPWGAGKSSLLNLVVEALAEDAENDIRVLHFSPWSYDSTDKLVHAFIEMLRAELAELSGRLRISSALSDLETALLAMPATGVWAVVKSWWYASESSPLEVAREKIHQALREESSKRRFVVILDDLDRLDAESLRLALKLTRLIADFPGIIYLLGYDRAQVEKLLGEHGREYLEKFVQCSFSVPPAAEHELKNYFETQVNRVWARVTGAQDTSPDEFKHQMGRYWNAGLAKILSNIREINVLVNSLDVTLRPIGDDVNIADAVALEAIRLRNPDLIDAIARGRRWFLGRQLKDTDEEWSSKYREWFESVTRDQIGDGVRGVLLEMFPVVGVAFKAEPTGRLSEVMRNFHGIQGCGPKEGATDHRNKRIYTSRYFERYFRKKLAGEVAEETLRRFRGSLENVDELRQLARECEIHKFVDELGEMSVGERCNVAMVIAERKSADYSVIYEIDRLVGNDFGSEQVAALVAAMGLEAALRWTHQRRSDDAVVAEILRLTLGSREFWMDERVADWLVSLGRGFSVFGNSVWLRHCRGWEKLSDSEFRKLVQKIMIRFDIAPLFFQAIPRDVVLDKLRNITPAEDPDIDKLIEFATATEQAG